MCTVKVGGPVQWGSRWRVPYNPASTPHAARIHFFQKCIGVAQLDRRLGSCSHRCDDTGNEPAAENCDSMPRSQYEPKLLTVRFRHVRRSSCVAEPSHGSRPAWISHASVSRPKPNGVAPSCLHAAVSCFKLRWVGECWPAVSFRRAERVASAAEASHGSRTARLRVSAGCGCRN